MRICFQSVVLFHFVLLKEWELVFTVDLILVRV